MDKGYSHVKTGNSRVNLGYSYVVIRNNDVRTRIKRMDKGYSHVRTGNSRVNLGNNYVVLGVFPLSLRYLLVLF